MFLGSPQVQYHTLLAVVLPPNIVMVIERLIMAAYVGQIGEDIVCFN